MCFRFFSVIKSPRYVNRGLNKDMKIEVDVNGCLYKQEGVSHGSLILFLLNPFLFLENKNILRLQYKCSVWDTDHIVFYLKR